MKHDIFLTLFKSVIIFAIILVSYYFLILKPKLELPNKIVTAQKMLSQHHSTLLQNKLSLEELTLLDQDSNNFNFEKSNLVAIIKKTNDDGLKNLSEENVTELPEVINDLTKRYPELISETNMLYENQNILLEKVFATDNFKAGIIILESEESVNLLLAQTKLILEFEEWLILLKELQ